MSPAAVSPAARPAAEEETAAVSENAEKVSLMIGALGGVTLEDADAVRAAREAYEALGPEERTQVKGLSELVSAEETIRELSVKNAASILDGLIRSVRKVTLEQRDTVRAVRAAYEAAEPEVKAQVRMLATLMKAEKKIHRLEVADAAAQFDASVARLGEITLESEAGIRALREDYDALDEEVRAAVQSLDELDRAEETFVFLGKKARAEEMDAAISALGRVTLESENDLRALRRQYVLLPEDVRELVTASEKLSQAESELQSLKDKAVAAEVRKLAEAGKYDEAIDRAEDYMEGREISDVRGGLVKNCLKAYAEKGSSLIRKGRYEEAYDLLRFCRTVYAGSDLDDVNEVWNELKTVNAEPRNGQVFDSTAQGGYCTLTVKAGDSPVFVKVVRVNNPESLVSVYVRAKKSATVKVREGTYTIRFATGEKWFGTSVLFGSGTRYITLDNNYKFEVRTGGGYRYASDLQLTLIPVAGGQETFSEIMRKDF